MKDIKEIIRKMFKSQLNEYGVIFQGEKYFSVNAIKKGEIYYRLPENRTNKPQKVKAISDAEFPKKGFFEDNSGFMLEPMQIPLDKIFKLKK